MKYLGCIENMFAALQNVVPPQPLDSRRHDFKRLKTTGFAAGECSNIVLRELASGQVVYETHVNNDGPYDRGPTRCSVMLEAALPGINASARP